jgi:UDP-N-acetylmuramate--alanine ligase
VLGRTRRIHFVGIGGIGMSGIAELLANLGYQVSGSDAKLSAVTTRLASLGVEVHEGHAAEHVGSADVVVVSSAIRPLNPEVIEARRRHVPVIPRAEMLAELMRLRFGIAVAGAHGKTSTTSMVAHLLERVGLDPTAVIGGKLSTFGSNAKLGRGDYMVVEADESDGSFLRLSPAIAVITNVDREHLDHYGDFDRVCAAFVEFANKVPFYGAVIACVDDPPLRALVPRFTRRVITCGLESAEADLFGEDVRFDRGRSRCRLMRRLPGQSQVHVLGELSIGVPGRHNLQNAVAAIAVAIELDVAPARALEALADFRGADRRFQVLGVAGGVTVVDDYGHHPTEVAAVLAAARTLEPKRVIVAFQPHRFTRTQHLCAEFGMVLARADEVVLTDIYAAGEDPIPGVTIESVAESVMSHTRAPVHIVTALADVAPRVASLVREGDLVVTLGAGSIGTVGERILQALRDRAPGR